MTNKEIHAPFPTIPEAPISILDNPEIINSKALTLQDSTDEEKVAFLDFVVYQRNLLKSKAKELKAGQRLAGDTVISDGEDRNDSQDVTISRQFEDRTVFASFHHMLEDPSSLGGAEISSIVNRGESNTTPLEVKTTIFFHENMAEVYSIRWNNLRSEETKIHFKTPYKRPGNLVL